jgi:IS1 family transposase
MDELWSYVGKKQRTVRKTDDAARVGDQWTYIAIDADTKLIPTFLVGKREAHNTNAFVADVAARMRNRVQISTDGLRQYIDAIRTSFGENVDYAMIVKEYEAEATGPGRYSPPRVSATEKIPVIGQPDERVISTSFVERQNLTMRTNIRRFTRLTNGFSKKLENHVAAIALHLGHYNFVRQHKTLRVTPAMAAGVESRMWSMAELLEASAS